MAFNVKKFNVHAYANGFTLWTFLTDDTEGDLDEDNYFNDANEMVRKGDMILADINVCEGYCTRIYLVEEIVDGVVEVTNFSNVNPATLMFRYNAFPAG